METSYLTPPALSEAVLHAGFANVAADVPYVLPLPTSDDHGGRGTQLRQYFARRHRGAAAASPWRRTGPAVLHGGRSGNGLAALSSPWRLAAPAVLHGRHRARRRRFGSPIPMEAARRWRRSSGRHGTKRRCKTLWRLCIVSIDSAAQIEAS